jgi:hypothetical protein
VPLQAVRQLVGEDHSKLSFVLQSGQQSCRDADPAVWQRKRIQKGIFQYDDVERVFPICAHVFREQSLHYLVEVLLEIRTPIELTAILREASLLSRSVTELFLQSGEQGIRISVLEEPAGGT